MANKQKAWREASRANTIEGLLTKRQFIAAQRDFDNRRASGLLCNLLTRVL